MAIIGITHMVVSRSHGVLIENHLHLRKPRRRVVCHALSWTFGMVKLALYCSAVVYFTVYLTGSFAWIDFNCYGLVGFW